MTSTTDTSRPLVRRDWGIWLLALAALLGLALTIYYEADGGDGIHGTPGLLLVVISTALMLAASLVVARGAMRGWLHGILSFLIVLDIVCTAAAGYFLESELLVGLMAIAFVGWLGHTFMPSRNRLAARGAL